MVQTPCCQKVLSCGSLHAHLVGLKCFIQKASSHLSAASIFHGCSVSLRDGVGHVCTPAKPPPSRRSAAYHAENQPVWKCAGPETGSILLCRAAQLSKNIRTLSGPAVDDGWRCGYFNMLDAPHRNQRLCSKML